MAKLGRQKTYRKKRFQDGGHDGMTAGEKKTRLLKLRAHLLETKAEADRLRCESESLADKATRLSGWHSRLLRMISETENS